MASFRKRGKSWEAAVARKGRRETASFTTKAEAQRWAHQIEEEILAESRGEVPNKPFSAILARYRDEISPTKKGERWETIRLNMLIKDELARVALPDLDAAAVAAWRDRRLKEVSPASVQREWNLLSAAITVAVREWGWLRDNPLKQIRRPPTTKARTRRIADDELRRLLMALGFELGYQPKTVSGHVGAALAFAVETAMRAGEIAGLEWANVNLDRRTAFLPETKNGESRMVPLSTTAIEIIKPFSRDRQTVFGISTAQIDALFRKARSRCQIADLHFHDSRREALSRLSAKLNPFELAKVSGHKDLKILLNTYYQADAEGLAAKIG